MTGFKGQFSHATLALAFVFVCSAKLGKFVGQLRRIGSVRETLTIGGAAGAFNGPLVVKHTNIRILRSTGLRGLRPGLC